MKTECLACPAGMDCDDPKLPQVCPDSKYQNPSSMGCQYCEKGSYCKNGIKNECPPSFFCPHDRMSEPYQCFQGYYCKGSQFEPTRCPVKQYSEIGWSECDSCPAGFHCEYGVKLNCPKGRDINFRLQSQILNLHDEVRLRFLIIQRLQMSDD